MQRWCDWIEDLLTRGGILTSDNIHRANRIGLYLRRAWFTAPSEVRKFLRSAVEFFRRMVFGVHIFVIGGIAGPIALIENLVPGFNLSTSTWWKLLWFGLAAAALWTFHKIRKERDDARNNFEGKSETLKLARELSESYPSAAALNIGRLKKMIRATTGAPTVEQVEDEKRKLICYIKNDREKLIGTPWESALGYKDSSEEMTEILELDASDISGSLNTLWDELMRFSNRKSTAIETMNASAAAITADTSSD